MVGKSPDSKNTYQLEYLTVVPTSINSGVEQTIIQLALKTVYNEKAFKAGDTIPQIQIHLSEEFIRPHQEQVFVPILTQ